MPRTWQEGLGLVVGMWLAFELLVPYVSGRVPIEELAPPPVIDEPARALR